ncbi:hypothetical protein BH09ACT8_BH09ACT8_63880 [soil metagenome]
MAKSGSRGKIQDRCCHGLIASAASQRRTVAAEIVSAISRLIASVASSALDHRDNGAPVSAGSVQASALTSATCTGVNLRRRPARGESSSPDRPAAVNRRRHLRTVSTCTPTCAAITVFAAPPAAASTIRARITSRCAAVDDRARACRTDSSSRVKVMTYGLLMAMGSVVPPPGSLTDATHRNR